jgi:type IV pilus assembly protein PilA
MKSEFKAKLIQHLLKNKKGEGFTLIELLVVVIIIGVLAAIALPNLLAQVGKARESELKNTVGTVNRAQQAFHFERATFTGTISDLGVTVTTQYQQTPTLAATAASATVATAATGYATNGTRAFSGRIESDTAGNYTLIVCGTNALCSAGVAPTGTSACPANTAQLR